MQRFADSFKHLFKISVRQAGCHTQRYHYICNILIPAGSLALLLMWLKTPDNFQCVPCHKMFLLKNVNVFDRDSKKQFVSDFKHIFGISECTLFSIYANTDLSVIVGF